MSQRIYCIAALVSHFVLGCATTYLCDLYCSVFNVAVRQVLCSAMVVELLVPLTRLAITQCHVFSVVGSFIGNCLPFKLHSLPVAHLVKFYMYLKSFFFSHDWLWKRFWVGSWRGVLKMNDLVRLPLNLYRVFMIKLVICLIGWSAETGCHSLRLFWLEPVVQFFPGPIRDAVPTSLAEGA